MKKRTPLWAYPARKRKSWRIARDASLDVCEKLKLDTETYGRAIYEAITACVNKSDIQFVMACLDYFPKEKP